MRRARSASAFRVVLGSAAVVVLVGCAGDPERRTAGVGAGRPASVAPTTETTAPPAHDDTMSVLDTATTAAEALLAYDHRTLDQDLGEVHDLMTPQGAEEYEAVFEVVRDNAADVQVVATAEVLAAGLAGRGGSAGSGTASVLLVVEQTATTTSRPDPTATTNDVLVDLREQGGAWRVESLGTPGTSSTAGTTTLDPHRAGAADAARRLVEDVTTYGAEDVRDPDDYRARLAQVATPDLAAQLADQLESFAGGPGIASTGTATATAVTAVSANTAEVLAVSTAVRTLGGQELEPAPFRVEAVLRLDGARWFVVGMDPVTAR